MYFQNGLASVQVDSLQLSANLPSEYKGGFIGFGTGGFYSAHFDEFKIIKGKKINVTVGKVAVERTSLT